MTAELLSWERVAGLPSSGLPRPRATPGDVASVGHGHLRRVQQGRAELTLGAGVGLAHLPR